MVLKIALLPGDGIGPEVSEQAVRVLETLAGLFGHEVSVESYLIGGAALAAEKDPLPGTTVRGCASAGAVLLGAVGGPAFDHYPAALRPESGLLRLRRELGVFANLRPAECFAGLEECSPLRPELVRGTDLVIVRELLGGLYFGEPRRTEGAPGHRTATDTMQYTEAAIERVARVAFELAQKRRRRVVSVDKANVLDCSRLWREVAGRVAAGFPGVTLTHAYVDSFAMALGARPAEFDVVLTENMFGDILSDQAGGVVGSLGLLASASLGGSVALYEPVHGSAPDIAGRGIANPLGAILSVAMMLRHSFGLEREAVALHGAVAEVLRSGACTADLARGRPALSTSQMGARVIEELRRQAGRVADSKSA